MVPGQDLNPRPVNHKSVAQLQTAKVMKNSTTLKIHTGSRGERVTFMSYT